MTPQILVGPLPGTTSDPLYPDSDGKPMSETDFHSNPTRPKYSVATTPSPMGFKLAFRIRCISGVKGGSLVSGRRIRVKPPDR